ncbi:MAG: hypothetical protein IT226_00810 [Flavobacteriales bacterium]|nr:hypothetical protein [Flavobacteriales bacterium]
MTTPALRIIATNFPLPAVRKGIARMAVVHNGNWSPAVARIMREVTNPKYSAFERDYLEWYHHDPLKRSTREAQKHSYNHRMELIASRRCGCFQCGAIFRPTEITEWMEDSTDHTASCPDCDTDAVIGDASGYPITTEFLLEMQQDRYPGS